MTTENLGLNFPNFTYTFILFKLLYNVRMF